MNILINLCGVAPNPFAARQCGLNSCFKLLLTESAQIIARRICFPPGESVATLQTGLLS